MEEVFREVVRLLHKVGYKKVHWGIMRADFIGSPQARARWFCLATRPGADVARLQKLIGATKNMNFKDLARKPWNPKNKVEMFNYLKYKQTSNDKTRLFA